MSTFKPSFPPLTFKPSNHRPKPLSNRTGHTPTGITRIPLVSQLVAVVPPGVCMSPAKNAPNPSAVGSLHINRPPIDVQEPRQVTCTYCHTLHTNKHCPLCRRRAPDKASNLSNFLHNSLPISLLIITRKSGFPFKTKLSPFPPNPPGHHNSKFIPVEKRKQPKLTLSKLLLASELTSLAGLDA